ncbi:unnamed protein product [Orchesella dallaii]|uniref:P97 cofactor p47 n=1 Tax=Orchesella dallaii TaxID=48710 RepID=A0ABP1RR66_9HEXA
MSQPQNNDELVAQFRDVTGVDAERARFYLEAAGWQLQLATQSFYEGENDQDAMVQDQDSDPEVDAETRQRIEQNVAGMLQSMMASGGVPASTASGGKPKTKKPKKQPAQRTGPMTLDALRNQESEDESSEEEDRGQAFYAGGSQSSGQQVLGPPRKRDELVAEMFKKAREAGAQEVEGPPQMIKKKASGAAFSGAGYKLGDTTEAPPAGAGAVGGTSSSTANANSESREVILRLWSQGFTVNDGPLRSYQDPSNMEFLVSVKRGEVPRELIREFQGQEIEMTMEDKRHEDYAPPRGSVKAFTGKGQTLGSPSPVAIGQTAPLNDSDRQANEAAAREQIPLADGAPTANIQFRLADGTRLVARFNPSHTVNDLHSYINLARPQYAATNYVLTLFPNTELTDKTQTVETAKLSNSALIQKIKQ